MTRSLMQSLSTCLLLSAALFFSTACSPSVDLKIKNNASGTALFNAEISPVSEKLVRKFTGNTDTGTVNTIFDKDKITISLAKAGFIVDSLTFPGRTGLALALSFPELNGILEKAIIITKESRTMTVTLSRESVNAAVDLLSADTREYLDILMAPVFTGENRTREEYEGDIGAAYGPTLSKELRESEFSLTVHSPESVVEAQISDPGRSKITGMAAVFTIPLSVLLTMEKPITAVTRW